MNYTITAKCENGHTQQIGIDGSLGKDWAVQQAAMLDGTSGLYLYPPGPESIIGKCGICRTQIECTVTEAFPSHAGETWPEKPRATLSGNPPAEGMEGSGAPQPIDPETGMHRDYWVLPEEERAKGFVRPYRDRYKHSTCGGVTTMGRALSETYARQPDYYGSTFCARCKEHYRVAEFTWVADGTLVGS